MATSGTFTKSQGSYLHLDLLWSRIETDVAGNRSKIRLTLQLRQTGTGLKYSANKTGTLHGVSFTHTGGFSGPGTKTIQTRDVWVSHNSDGTKSQSFSATYNIAINYSGSWLASMTVSGVADITAIPRASSLSSFSFGSSLKTSTANTISLSISRASTSFTHDIELRDGTTVIRSWTGQGLPTSLDLTAANVTTLLGRMSAVSSKSLTLRVQTKSGTTNIGTAVTRNATATVDSSIKPTASKPTIGIYGSGRDSVLGLYVQNITRVTANFNATATGGATVSSTKIVVKRTTGANTQTITGTSGTTTSAITASGSYTVIATTTDSRGRSTDSTETTFTSQAYSPPAISIFTPVRNVATQTTVNIARSASWSRLSGQNTATELIQRRLGAGGAWTTLRNVTTDTGSITTAYNSTGNNIANSYQFRMTLTDSFGNSAMSEASISTQKVVLDIHRDSGVGIGKLHEYGALDVSGDIYMNDQTLTSQFAPTSHNHSATNINSGTLSYLRIPRGTTSTTVAIGNHSHSGYAASSHTHREYTSVTATLTNGWTGTLYYTKFDTGRVALEGVVYPGTISSGTVITTIPAAYRTAYAISIPIYDGNAGVSYIGLILTGSGALTVRSPLTPSLTSGSTVRINATWQNYQP